MVFLLIYLLLGKFQQNICHLAFISNLKGSIYKPSEFPTSLVSRRTLDPVCSELNSEAQVGCIHTC